MTDDGKITSNDLFTEGVARMEREARQTAYRVILDMVNSADDVLMKFPPDEQERIADAIDGLMVDLYRLVEKV